VAAETAIHTGSVHTTVHSGGSGAVHAAVHSGGSGAVHTSVHSGGSGTVHTSVHTEISAGSWRGASPAAAATLFGQSLHADIPGYKTPGKVPPPVSAGKVPPPVSAGAPLRESDSAQSNPIKNKSHKHEQRVSGRGGRERGGEGAGTGNSGQQTLRHEVTQAWGTVNESQPREETAAHPATHLPPPAVSSTTHVPPPAVSSATHVPPPAVSSTTHVPPPAVSSSSFLRGADSTSWVVPKKRGRATPSTSAASKVKMHRGGVGAAAGSMLKLQSFFRPAPPR